MRAHQPGSIPIDIPETVPNPAYTPAPAPAPERAPTKVPEKVPEKVIAPDHPGRSSFRREYGQYASIIPLGPWLEHVPPELNSVGFPGRSG